MVSRLRAFLSASRAGAPVVDWLLSAGLAVLVVLELVSTEAFPASPLIAVPGALMATLTLAYRRRWPLEVALIAAGGGFLASIGHSASDDSDSFAIIIALLVTLYSLGAYTSGWRVPVGALIVVAAICLIVFTDKEGPGLDGFIFFTIVIGAPWVAGRAIRRRRSSERVLEHRASAAEAERDRRAREAVAEERARIARELHDVVAHSVSVMILQAQGGSRLIDKEPESARAALATIEHIGRTALDEMRRLLGVLRQSDEEVALAPAQSLDHLPALVQQIERAGLPVELVIEGERRPVPPGVDVSAYRIVQEALTNALKHAGPARARVHVRYTDHDLELEIVDDGTGPAEPAVPGGGHGLVGMRERVAIFGGELRAGARTEGGYALRVRLPLDPSAT